MPRIPSTAIHHRTLIDLRRSLEAQAALQRQLATGRRVERPSDDPTAAARILPLQTDLREFDRMARAAEAARGTLDLGADALQQASEIMARLREIATEAANSTKGQPDRDSMATEVDQLLDQLRGLANTSRGGRYLFGGTVEDRPPFEILEQDGRARIRYAGDQLSRRALVAPDVRVDVNIPGDRLFGVAERGATRYEGDTGAAPGPAFDTGRGTARLEFSFAGLRVPTGTTGIAAGDGATTALGRLDYVFTAPDSISINGGPETLITGGSQEFPVGAGDDVVSLDITLPIDPPTGTLTAEAWATVDAGATRQKVDFTRDRIVVLDSLDDSELHVDVSGLARTGVEEITFEGTFDAFTAAITLREQLRNRDGAPDDVVRDRLRDALGAITAGHDATLAGLQDLGSRSASMELLINRVESLTTRGEDELSRIRDVDIAAAISELQLLSQSYEAALAVTGRTLNLSLLNFLG